MFHFRSNEIPLKGVKLITPNPSVSSLFHWHANKQPKFSECYPLLLLPRRGFCLFHLLFSVPIVIGKVPHLRPQWIEDVGWKCGDRNEVPRETYDNHEPTEVGLVCIVWLLVFHWEADI